MPFLFTICLLALAAAALNCKGHFAYPALAPVLLNVALIAAGLWLAPALAEGAAGQFHVLAVALVAAGAVQLAGVVWMLRAADLAVVPRLRPVLPEVRRIARLMAPMLVPLGIAQLVALADRVIALALTRSAAHPDLPVAPGAVRCLYAAGRLYQLPLGVLAVSIATVVFPLLGRYAARNDLAGLRETLNRALRMGAFVALPAGVGLILLAEPAIALIFQRKEFGPADTARTVLLLRLYCLGMCAYFWTPVLLRAFFSRQDARTPMVLALAMAGAHVALVLVLVWTPLRAGAIALATALTQTANALALIAVMRRRWGRLGGRRVLASFARTTAATAAMAAAVLGVLHGLGALLAGAAPTSRRLAVVVVCVVAGAAVYLLAARLLGMAELGELLGARKRGARYNREHE
jgi:putative peptidoglycan lipid II flippase